MITHFIFLSLIACSTLPAASELIKLPYEEAHAEEYAQHDEFFVQLRNNNAPYVIEHLDAQSRYSYRGKLTLLHIITAMEHFHGHNPRAIIDALANKAAKQHYGPHHLALTDLCQARANVNHPDFHFFCTGKKLKRPGLPKLLLSPIELARRFASIKTLCALDAYTTDVQSDIRLLFNNPQHQHDFDLAVRMISQDRWRNTDGLVYVNEKIARPIITNFGTESILLMHRYGIELFKIPQHHFNRSSLYEIFAELHPDKVHEIDHLKPVPQKPILTKLKEWWNGASSSSLTEQSSSSSTPEESEESEEDEEYSDLEDDLEEV